MTRRRAFAVVSVVAAVIAVGWFWRSEVTPDVGATQASATVEPEANILSALLSRPVAAPRGSLRIRGTVQGDQGPVALATVTVTRLESGERLADRTCACSDTCGLRLIDCGCGGSVEQLLNLINQREGEAEPLARTKSDADGGFVLEGLAAGDYTVWADSSLGSAVLSQVTAGTDDARLDLVPLITLSGRVVDEQQAGVADARVIAILSEHARVLEVTSGPDGSFSLPGVSRGEYAVLGAADGWVPAHLHATPDHPIDLHLELLRPRKISGRVIQRGEPIAKAVVKGQGDHRVISAISDAQGSFVLDGLRPATYSVTAEAKEGVAQRSVEVSSDVSEVVLELGPAGGVEGLVHDDQGAVAGAEVTVFVETDGEFGNVHKVKSDPQGHFTVSPLTPGQYQTHVKAPRRLELAAPVTKVLAGPPAHLDLLLKPAALLGGRIVDEGNHAIAGAEVMAYPAAPDANEPQASTFGNTTSLDGGGFLVDGLAAGSYTLRITASDFVDSEQTATAPNTQLALVLNHGAELSGRVVDGEDHPIKGAQVSTYPDTTVRGDQRLGNRWAETSADGTFRIRGLKAGPYLVVASDDPDRAHEPPGRGGRRGGSRRTTQSVTVSEGGTASVVLKLDASGTLAGVVQDTSGQALAGAQVLASTRSPDAPRSRPASMQGMFAAAPAMAMSDADGGFLLRYLAEGTYYVWGELSGYHRVGQPTQASAGAEGLVVTLAPSAQVTGHVVDESGAPVPQFSVAGNSFTGADGGAFSVVVEPAGPYHLPVTARGYASTTLEGSVAEGQQRDVGDVVLGKGRSIHGQVVDAAGQPVAGAMVMASGPVGSDSASRFAFGGQRPPRTSADGTFVIEHASSSTVRLTVDDHLHAALTRDVAPDEDHVTLTLGKGATVRGTIVDAQQQPIATGVEVEMLDGATARRGTSDGSGQYEVTGLPGGEALVNVEMGGNQPWSGNQGLAPKPVTLAADGTATVDFAATAAGATLQVAVGPDLASATTGLVAGDVPTPTGLVGFKQLYAKLSGPVGNPQSNPASYQGLADGTYTLFAFSFDDASAQGSLSMSRKVVVISGGADVSVTIGRTDGLVVVPLK